MLWLQILCTTSQINPLFAKNGKNCHFHFFSYFLKYATQTPTKLPNTDLFHVKDLQAYKTRHLMYLKTLYGRKYTKNLRFFQFLGILIPNFNRTLSYGFTSHKKTRNTNKGILITLEQFIHPKYCKLS